MYTSFAKVDWNTFNYIHSNNTREAFQRLTEQLFCVEFKQPYGNNFSITSVLRAKNSYSYVGSP